MVAGILLAELASIDEIGLRGLGREIWPVGVAMGVGGLLLAGAPVGLMAAGSALLETAGRMAGRSWVVLVVVFAAACTGGAVLRAAGRIFLGWGRVAGEERRAPTEDEREKANRPLWVMLLPSVVLLALAVLGGETVQAFARRAAVLFMHPDNRALLGGMNLVVPAGVVARPDASLAGWVSVALALMIAGFNLARGDLPRRLPQAVDAGLRPLFWSVQKLHSGLIGDYVTWLVVGLALFAGAFMWSW